ncbi:hypothetical protein ACFQZZ_06155 [Nocardia sp. GCM10030253]|uniref:hypothetical protein n=1 Tax=Nocardia sp. GCM10030253 TaxID=3273404 RepID=UPI003643AF00
MSEILPLGMGNATQYSSPIGKWRYFRMLIQHLVANNRGRRVRGDRTSLVVCFCQVLPGRGFARPLDGTVVAAPILPHRAVPSPARPSAGLTTGAICCAH